MNVVCVWWTAYTGGLGQYRYSKKYVDSLSNQLLERGHELTVLTDTEHGRPLLSPNRYKGWFSKIEVFRSENRDLRPCLCIDLDTLILGDIAPILALDPTRLWLIRNFFLPKRSESGLFIAPRDGVSADIWKRAELLHGFPKGDSDFLSEFPHSLMQDAVDGIKSYKADHLYEDPKGARMVCFHGKPRPEQAEGWAKRFWYGHIEPR